MILETPSSVTPRFRMAYGFAPGATLGNSVGTCAPLQFTAVRKITFYFAGSVGQADANNEWDLRWAYVRTWAYGALACQSTPVISCCSGEPICGILEQRGSAEYAGSSMLVGWAFCTHAECPPPPLRLWV